MSEEVVLVSVVQPAPGKVDRFKEVLHEAVAWIKENEPGFIEYTLCEEQTESGIKIFMVERFASQEALDEHEASDHYKGVFETMTKEQLLEGTPVMNRGKYFGGFRR